jgi:cysteine desulfuration protein SufE
MTKQAQLISDLLLIPDVQERMSAVVASATKVGLPEHQRSDDLLVKGCASRVWLLGHVTDGRLHLQSDADSPLVKGLVHLLCSIYNGESLQDIVAEEPQLWQALGFAKNLSPTRQNGLAAVRSRIRELATPVQ